MAEIGLRSKMLVKDVMSSPVITIEETASANLVANLMDKEDLGCIIVTNKEGKPLGIITERDLVVRVLAKNAKPDSLKASDVMTSPLITIEPDATISDAARRMSRSEHQKVGSDLQGADHRVAIEQRHTGSHARTDRNHSRACKASKKKAELPRRKSLRHSLGTAIAVESGQTT